MTARTNIWIMLRSLIISYVITGVLLLFAALLLYRLEPQQSMVSVGILVIYVLSSFFGGLLAGKGIRSRKFLWGLATGALYFLMLLAASWISGGQVEAPASQIITTMLLCLGGGMLGGMLA
ncbi:TIGR04086 family membrane protein [Marvinbryantia formatexigens]|nr:TIGR04086 family membrane protein [Marvinbryantia formatexigens]UWO25124.1 TIGR04086 family membrane protein [Marvinbryantia formatexigens DSM 14469]SDG96356.1 putative membrane protein, TIGR04086 family [Marvinbryantia formatexigens]